MGTPLAAPAADTAGAQHTRRAFEYEHAHQDRSDLCAFVPARVDELLADLDLPRAWFAGKRVLDAGCGGGRWSWALARLGARVTALDFTATGVAATAAALAPFPDCRAAVADLTDPATFPPDVAPGAFDLVLSWGVLHHTEHPEATFRNLVPLVAPGGYLYVMVYGETSPVQDALTDIVRAALRPLPPDQRYEACRALVLANPAQQRALWPFLYVYYADPADPVAYERALFACYDCYSPRWNHRYPVTEVARWFAAAGLTDLVQTRAVAGANHVRGRKEGAA